MNEPIRLGDLMRESCRIAQEHGFALADEPDVSEFIALVHTELSEAFEAWRAGDAIDSILMEDGKPEGVPSELADVVIRVCQWCQRYNVPLEEAIRRKMAYNETRPYRHGGKRC